MDKFKWNENDGSKLSSTDVTSGKEVVGCDSNYAAIQNQQELATVRSKIAETEAEIAETKAKLKKFEEEGNSDMTRMNNQETRLNNLEAGLNILSEKELLLLKQQQQQQQGLTEAFGTSGLISSEDIYKLKLLDHSEYLNNLDVLLNYIENANLPGPKSDIINNYRKSKRSRESDAYALTIEAPSSVASKDCFDMSNFDIKVLYGESKVSITVVQLSGELRVFIAEKLFSGSDEALNNSLFYLTSVLNKLRSHFFYLREKKHNVTEPMYYQPLYTLFLERVAQTIGKSTYNLPGASFPLSMEVSVALVDGNCQTATVSGKTDIVKVPSEGNTNFDDIEFLLELKQPFASLYHASSDRPKGQLVCQLLGLWEQSSEKRNVTMGGLSDFFALIICFAYSDKKRDFTMTRSVVDAEEYLLHLMLLFCSDHDVRELIKDVEEEEEEDSFPPLKTVFHEGHNDKSLHKPSDQEPDADNGGRKLRSFSRRTTSADSTHKYMRAFTAEEYDDCLEGEIELQKWYARHNGFLPLNKENIKINQRHYS